MDDNGSNLPQESELAIRLGEVSKYFLLPHTRSNSAKSGLINFFKYGRSKTQAEKQQVLSDININVAKGEFLGIVGRNGSGKSTLLKILAGVYQPSSGTVEVNGRLVPFIELGVGFNGELTARENIYLNGAILGYTRPEIEHKVDEIIQFAELERFIDQKLKNYSSGMQVRLAFSVATRLSESDILLIDEVLAVGDADFQRKCFHYFKQLKKRRKTVVLVTHDMNAVREYCDRAILIENSHIVKEGSPDEIGTLYTQLFEESIQHDDPAEVVKRWGDGRMKFVDVSLSKKLLKDADRFLVVTAEIAVYKNIDQPIFGISVMNEAGERIFGTNTDLRRMHPGKLIENQGLEVTWQVPHIFNGGDYDVCLSAAEPGGVSCDSWDNVCTFTVRKEMSTSFPVNPDIEMTIIKR